jgi:hypothetical protein
VGNRINLKSNKKQNAQSKLTRRQVAIVLDKVLNPFAIEIDHKGDRK